MAGWEVPRPRHHHRQRDRGRDRRRDAFASAVTRRCENGNGTANLGASGGMRIYLREQNEKSLHRTGNLAFVLPRLAAAFVLATVSSKVRQRSMVFLRAPRASKPLNPQLFFFSLSLLILCLHRSGNRRREQKSVTTHVGTLEREAWRRERDCETGRCKKKIYFTNFVLVPLQGRPLLVELL